MGMGYGANVADVIEPAEIKKVGKCKELMKKFESALESAGTDGDSFAQAMSCCDDDPKQAAAEVTDNKNDGHTIAQAYEALVEEFERQTSLDLMLSYHSSEDNGDRYDDVDGAYWWVGGFRDISAAGKKAQKQWKITIEQRGFVTFG